MQESGRQTLVLQNRRELRLDGVADVVSFDDTSVLLKTNMGILSIDGEELRIVSFREATANEDGRAEVPESYGNITIVGQITSLGFIDRAPQEEQQSGGGFLGIGRRRSRR